MRDTHYEWWPAYQPLTFDIADRNAVPLHVLGVGVFAALLCLPAVTHATGIAPITVALLIALHLAWHVFAVFVLARSDVDRTRGNMIIAGNLTVNVTVAVAIPIATHDPATPLWMLPVLYACLNGAMQERRPCLTFLLAHALAPLVALVFLLDGRARTDWSIAAPVLCAVMCTVAYNHLAVMSSRWRRLRIEQETAMTELRGRIAVRDRERLMEDVQHSVGTTLSLVATYGDLVERHLDRPHELRAIARMVRDAARAGLGDLRSVLGALAPRAGDLEGVVATMRRAAAQMMDQTTIKVSVRADGANVQIHGAARLVIVRAFQHAIQQARDRADTRTIEAVLQSDTSTIRLSIEDDGACTRDDFDQVGMLDKRVAELGGTLARVPVAARGMLVRVSLPRG